MLALKKSYFPVILLALLNLVNLNKRGGYLNLSNLINWRNVDHFSTLFLVGTDKLFLSAGHVVIDINFPLCQSDSCFQLHPQHVMDAFDFCGCQEELKQETNKTDHKNDKPLFEDLNSPCRPPFF